MSLGLYDVSMGIMGESDSLLGDLEDDFPRLQVRRRGRDHGHESCDAVGERGLVVATDDHLRRQLPVVAVAGRDDVLDDADLVERSVRVAEDDALVLGPEPAARRGARPASAILCAGVDDPAAAAAQLVEGVPGAQEARTRGGGSGAADRCIVDLSCVGCGSALELRECWLDAKRRELVITFLPSRDVVDSKLFWCSEGSALMMGRSLVDIEVPSLELSFFWVSTRCFRFSISTLCSMMLRMCACSSTRSSLSRLLRVASKTHLLCCSYTVWSRSISSFIFLASRSNFCSRNLSV